MSKQVQDKKNKQKNTFNNTSDLCNSRHSQLGRKNDLGKQKKVAKPLK